MRNKIFVIALVLVGLATGIGIYYVMMDYQPSKQVIDTNNVPSNRFFLSGDSQGLKEASKPGGECSLDYLAQDGKRIDREGIALPEINTQFYGWGVVDGRLPSELMLEIKPIDSSAKPQSLYAKMGAGGVERNDVVSVTGRKNLLNAGYYAEGNFSGADGTYDLFLLMKTQAGLYQCNLNYRISVKRNI
jgi:hypothetical protein